MEKRILGKTGAEVSVFGFGGIVVASMEQDEANRTVAEAVDRGVNYFDVAPSYGDAEDRLGPALQPYRTRVTLACKTAKRTRKEAADELRQSLQKLRTDHFDVYQLHALDKRDEIETALGPGGALEAFVEARDKGLVRYIGFSAHSEEATLTLMERFDFDTVLFPVNWVYWLKGHKGEEVLRVAEQKNMGRIAMKGLVHRVWLHGEEKAYPKCWYRPIFDNPELAALALRFTLSRDVHVALSPGDARMLRLGLDIVLQSDTHAGLSAPEVKRLSEIAAETELIFQ